MIIIGSRRKSSSLHTRTIPSYGLDKPSLVFTPNSDVEEDGEDEGDDEDCEDCEDEEEEGEDYGGCGCLWNSNLRYFMRLVFSTELLLNE